MILELFAFLAAFTVMAGASAAFTASLERIGARFRFSGALLGLTAALGADAPELSSAGASLVLGHNDVSIGVVLGSNIFNLAALLGFNAIIAGRIEIGRDGLLLNGGVGAVVTVAAAALVAGWIPPWAASAIIAAAFFPYVALSSLQAGEIARLPFPRQVRSFMRSAVEQAHRDTHKRKHPPYVPWKDAAIVIACLAAIVATCTIIVDSAVALAARWGLSHMVVGYFVLAIVTSIPNVIVAVRLALDGRGVAVVSETLNSNTFNVIGGICVAALVFGHVERSPRDMFSVIWLLGMSAAAIVGARSRRGLSPKAGGLLVFLYVAYVVAMPYV